MNHEFRVHFWRDGKDKGRISCPLPSWGAAEDWIKWWKSADPKFEDDDLRIHDSRSAGHINDQCGA